MIAAFIILLVLAVSLGAFITVAELRYKNRIAPVPVSVETDIAPESQADEAEEEADEAAELSVLPDPEVCAAEEENDDEIAELKPVTENGKTRYIVIKYSKSFTAKLIQSGDLTKRYYSELKNKLLSYDGVKSRISWKWETFRLGKKTLAKFRLRGKSLTVTLALDPNDFADTKYDVESLAEVKAYADTPSMYRVKNDRRLRLAKELIEKLTADNGLTEAASAENVDYIAQYPYEETDALVEKKLIKVLTDKDGQSGTKFRPSEVRESVAATEVDKIMTDDVAASLIEKSDGTIDKTKQGIINIDTLSQNFESGEVVTLAEIKKRIKGYGKTTYIKVLARGTLDKPLTVEADAFSLQAVKMIVLTGGTALKKRPEP